MSPRPWKCLYTKDQTLMILRAWGYSDKALPNKGVLELNVHGPVYTHIAITKTLHKNDCGKRLYEATLTNSCKHVGDPIPFAAYRVCNNCGNMFDPQKEE